MRTCGKRFHALSTHIVHAAQLLQDVAEALGLAGEFERIRRLHGPRRIHAARARCLAACIQTAHCRNCMIADQHIFHHLCISEAPLLPTAASAFLSLRGGPRSPFTFFIEKKRHLINRCLGCVYQVLFFVHSLFNRFIYPVFQDTHYVTSYSNVHFLNLPFLLPFAILLTYSISTKIYTLFVYLLFGL